MADETTAAKTEAQVSAAREAVHGDINSGTAVSAALVDAATQQIDARTAAAREKITGRKSITVMFEAEDTDLHNKILADAKADDREPNKYLLRWLRKNYKAGA